MLQALIFDVDGTLADTENVHRVSFNRAFATAGLDWHWDKTQYQALLKITGGKERIGHFIETQRDGAYTPLEQIELVKKLHRSKTRFYERLVAQGSLRLRPGVAELIKAAWAEGVRLAVATTTSPTNVGTLLKFTLGANAANMFDVIAAGDSVARKKPWPDVYWSTLAQLDLLPSDCLVIEDSKNGLRSALGAGLVTIITPSTYTASEDFSGAAKIVPSIAHLAQQSDRVLDGRAILKAIRAIHKKAYPSR